VAESIKNKPAFSNDINFGKIIALITRFWYWIAVSVVVFLIGARIYLNYKLPVYESGAMIKLESNQSSVTDYLSIDVFEGVKDQILTEVQVIQSRSIIEKAINTMPIEISYFAVGTLKTTELYNKSPFLVVPEFRDSLAETKKILYSVEYQGNNKFRIEAANPEGKKFKRKVRIGQPFEVEGTRMRIEKNPVGLPLVQGGQYQYKFNSINSLYRRFKENLFVKDGGK
jgi:hypothetical protein